MALTRLEIRERRPYFDGQSFGQGGVYERIDGVAHFAVDPGHEANAEIVDLERAVRDGEGLVRFEADFTILKPIEVAMGRGTLLFDVANRGNKIAMSFLNGAVPSLEPSDEIRPGNGFLMRHGFTVAWCGWQWDVPRGTPGLMGIDAPMALEGGRPIAGEVCVEIVTNAPAASWPLRDALGVVPFRSYAAADVNESGARMTVQEWPDGPRVEVPRESWRFARVEGEGVVADEECVWIEGGFEAGKTYDVVYTTRISPVAGVGLLAVRDFTSFLKHETDGGSNPCAGRIKRALGFGVSQSGRFLRTFLYHGLNVDEAGRRVFDGLNPHIAGGRRGEFNHRYAQPSVEVTPGFGHLAPFGDDGEGGLLAKQRALGGVPKVAYSNSSAEYWRGDAGLVHVSADGAKDLTLPENVRAYLFAGTQHGPGLWPLMSVSPVPGGPRLAHWINSLASGPLSRALVMTLDTWCRNGAEPPPSALPTVAGGTLTARENVLGAFAAIAGVSLPNPARLRTVSPLDLGPESERGIGRWPARATGAPFAALAPAVDGDGNEVAGIRLPDVAVPVAAYTGWNPRHPSMGAPEQIARYMGSTFPFAATRAEREASGDPRPSIAERYGGREEYAARVRAVAEKLLASRWLLEEVVEGVVMAAVTKWEAFRGSAAG